MHRYDLRKKTQQSAPCVVKQASFFRFRFLLRMIWPVVYWFVIGYVLSAALVIWSILLLFHPSSDWQLKLQSFESFGLFTSMFSNSFAEFWNSIIFPIMDACFYVMLVQGTIFAVNTVDACYLSLFLVSFLVYDQRSKVSLEIVAQSSYRDSNYGTFNLWPTILIFLCTVLLVLRMYMEQDMYAGVALFGVSFLNWLVGEIFMWTKKHNCCVHVAHLFLVVIPIAQVICVATDQSQIVNNMSAVWFRIMSVFFGALWLRVCAISIICLFQNK